jgi:predicted MPP superfamily phosphohydrolase
MKVVHLSDLHIDSKNNKDLIKNFKVINELKCYVIITGDITENGTKKEINIARNLIRKNLKNCKVFVVGGNHDFGEHGKSFEKVRFDLFKNAFKYPIINGKEYISEDGWVQEEMEKSGFLLYKQNETFTDLDEVIISDSGILFIGLESGIPEENEEPKERGNITFEQISSLVRILSVNELYDYKIVVFMHHHPFIRPNMNSNFGLPLYYDNEIENSHEFMEEIKGIDLLLFGHKHIHETWKNYHDIAMTSAADCTCNHFFEYEI